MRGVETVQVLAAVIEREGRFLICQRPHHKRYGGLWEFPGGKLLPGEDFECAAARELREELGIDVSGVGRLLFEQQDQGSPFLVQFLEVSISGEPTPIEHTQLAWVTAEALPDYSLAPVDRAFAFTKLLGTADPREDHQPT